MLLSCKNGRVSPVVASISGGGGRPPSISRGILDGEGAGGALRVQVQGGRAQTAGRPQSVGKGKEKERTRSVLGGGGRGGGWGRKRIVFQKSPSKSAAVLAPEGRKFAHPFKREAGAPLSSGPAQDAGEVIKLSYFLTPPPHHSASPGWKFFYHCRKKGLERLVLVSAVSAGWTADDILTGFAGRAEQQFDSSLRIFRRQVVLGSFGRCWCWWGLFLKGAGGHFATEKQQHLDANHNMQA